MKTELVLGVPGFTFADLYRAERLRDLMDLFDRELAAANPDLARRHVAWRARRDRGVPAAETSDMTLEVAPHVSRFVARLFRIEQEVEQLRKATVDETPVMVWKRDFVQRRAIKKHPAGPPE